MGKCLIGGKGEGGQRTHKNLVGKENLLKLFWPGLTALKDWKGWELPPALFLVNFPEKVFFYFLPHRCGTTLLCLFHLGMSSYMLDRCFMSAPPSVAQCEKNFFSTPCLFLTFFS